MGYVWLSRPIERIAYRTVRAWRSVGAPERTAAGRVVPGSLPSITRLGTGEYCLRRRNTVVSQGFCALGAGLGLRLGINGEETYEVP